MDSNQSHLSSLSLSLFTPVYDAQCSAQSFLELSNTIETHLKHSVVAGSSRVHVSSEGRGASCRPTSERIGAHTLLPHITGVPADEVLRETLTHPQSTMHTHTDRQTQRPRC